MDHRSLIWRLSKSANQMIEHHARNRDPELADRLVRVRLAGVVQTDPLPRGYERHCKITRQPANRAGIPEIVTVVNL
jgi:hypothetical protein